MSKLKKGMIHGGIKKKDLPPDKKRGASIKRVASSGSGEILKARTDHKKDPSSCHQKKKKNGASAKKEKPDTHQEKVDSKKKKGGKG